MEKMAPTRVVLMSCGSYNPPTHLHLRMFEIARDHLHRMGIYEVVGGVISLVHDDYGKKELAPAEHRCKMVKLAIQSSEWIRLSTWETRQNCWTKTRYSLEYHQNLLNSFLIDSTDINNCIDPADLDWIPENVKNGSDRTPIQIKLLCGADLLESFGKPGLWAEEDIEAILGQHGLVVITREGSNPNKFIYDSDILSKHMHNIYIVTEWIPNEVSSSRIRRALKRGESIRYLTQDSVIDYIYQNGIYDANITSTTTKFELSSNNKNNYLHIDNKYESTLLTPSPSDITMTTPSPVEIITIDIGDSILKRNQQINTINYENERINDKYVGLLHENNGNKAIKSSINSKTTYPGQAKQIITTETGESLIFYEVGPSLTENHESTNIETNDKSNLVNDNNPIDDISDKNNDDVLSLDCENSSKINISLPDDTNDASPTDQKSVDESKDEAKDESNTIVDESNSSTLCDNKIIEKLSPDLEEEPASVPDLDEQDDRKDTYNLVMQLRKSPKKTEIDGKYIKSIVNSRKSPNKVRNFEQVVPMMECDEIDGKMERKIYQGSLDSINKEPETLEQSKPKSKSFELLKSDMSLKTFDDIDLNEPSSPVQESEVFVTANDENDEFCAVCYSKEQFTKTPYQMRSNESSPMELDSPECDICNSLTNVGAAPDAATGLPQCERCEICGDIAMDEDIVASSRPEPWDVVDSRLSIASNPKLNRRKLLTGRGLDGRIFNITDEDCENINEEKEEEIEEINEPKDTEQPSTSIEEFSGDDSTLNDIEFEIENCGLDLDPIEYKKPPIIEEIKEDKIETLGNYRMNRGSSMISRSSETRNQARRRYRSVDNLPVSRAGQLKAFVKDEKSLVVKNNGKLIGSVDNIRTQRQSRSTNVLRKSADDIGKIKEGPGVSGVRLVRHTSEKSTRATSDTVKFILSKHGIKIISDKETAL